MNLPIFLLDVGPSPSVVGAAIAAAFLLVFLGVAFVAFMALKKTVKMAFRMTVVAVILLIAVVGSVSLFYFASTGGSPRLKPPVDRPTRK